MILRLQFLLLMMTLAACHKTDIVNFAQPQENEVRLSGRMEWSGTTGNGVSATGYPTDFGLWASDAGVMYASNLCYEFSDGDFTPRGAALTYPSSGQAELYAYAPYLENLQNGQVALSVAADQQSSEPALSDLLWVSKQIRRSDASHSLKFEHKFTKVVLELKPQNSSLPADTKIRLLGVKRSALLNLMDGALDMTDSDEGEIEPRKIDATHYETILPPQVIGTIADFVEVTGGGRRFRMKLKAAKTLLSNNIHRFEVDIKNRVPVLPYTVELKYKDVTLGSSLTVPATATRGELKMSQIPDKTTPNLKLRNAAGGNSWASINSDWNYIKDEIYSGKRDCLLLFDENTGAERTIYLEFYDKNNRNDVYHYLAVTQAEAANYLTLSQQSLSTDLYGNQYDVLLKLTVQSNRSWSIKNIPDWMEVNYKPGEKTQDVYIKVLENKTGASRSANLTFVSDGVIVKTFPVSQSATASASFTLKYEFDLEFNTINNRFRSVSSSGGIWYANDVQIFNNVGAGDATAKINSQKKYGFIADAPDSFNKLIVNDFANTDYFIVRNYNGSAQTITSGLCVVSANGNIPIFRTIRIGRLPVPAGVSRNQKVKFKVLINSLTDNAVHDTPIITATVVEQ